MLSQKCWRLGATGCEVLEIDRQSRAMMASGDEHSRLYGTLLDSESTTDVLPFTKENSPQTHPVRQLLKRPLVALGVAAACGLAAEGHATAAVLG